MSYRKSKKRNKSIIIPIMNITGVYDGDTFMMIIRINIYVKCLQGANCSICAGNNQR